MSTLWLYLIIGVVAVALVAGIVIAAIVLYRRQVRRALIGLTGRREAVRAAYNALESVFVSLAESSKDDLAAFAVDPGSEHRKALEELHSRMRIQAEELADIALPKRLWEAADLLCAASGSLAAETGRVGEANGAEGVLDALGKIDVRGIAAVLRLANAEIDRLLVEHRIEDPAVYGGGLYI